MVQNSIKNEDEYCYKELYRLLIFYKLMIKLLESLFEGGHLIIVDDEINKNYLRLSNKINEIVSNKCFQGYGLSVELPFIHLRSLDPDVPEGDWQCHGRIVCGDSLSEIEDLFIKTGENAFELSLEDTKFINSINNYLKAYNEHKKTENSKFLHNVKEIAKKYNPFESKSYKDYNVEFRINSKIWTYLERIYIHVYHSSKEFISFLEMHGISGYENSSYPLIYFEEDEKDNTDMKVFHHFMSNENNELANFMRSTPYNTQLNILSDAIFNEDIMRTKYDKIWNYYGVYIHEWYPIIINYLEAAGFRIDLRRRSIIYGFETLDFWDLVHEDIINVCKTRFNHGHYADAVESAFKEINIKIKGIVECKTGVEYDGKKLMDTAFSFSKTSEPIILLDDLSKSTGRNIQLGYKKLFSGSIQAIRNPKAHENITISREEAIHMIFLASLLMYKLDNAKNV